MEIYENKFEKYGINGSLDENSLKITFDKTIYIDLDRLPEFEHFYKSIPEKYIGKSLNKKVLFQIMNKIYNLFIVADSHYALSHEKPLDTQNYLELK